MNVKIAITISWLVFISYFSSDIVCAENQVDDFFAMSPAELAATPVTIATGTPKPVFQSAGVTSVITAEQIKSMGATELHEVLETVPGVHVSLKSGVTYDYHYTVRGIRNATNSQTLVLLNGTRITTPVVGATMTGLELPVEAIRRVEVIRGPGSALYGADAFAGVINIITKSAKDINGTALGARVGDHSTQSGWGQYGAQWAGWDVATSLQYQHTNGDGGRIIKADLQSTLDKAFGTRASHAPGAMNTNYETFNGHLNMQRKHWDVGFWAFNSTTGTRAGAFSALDPKGSFNDEQYLGDVRFSTEDWLDNWELMAHVSYLYSDLQTQFQAFPDNAIVPIGSDGNISSRPRGLVLFPDGVNENLGQIQQIPAVELSSVYKGFDNHLLRLSAGFRYEQLTTSELRNFGPGVIDGSRRVINGALTDVTGTPFVALPDTHRSIWSAVAQDEWQIADDWHLTTGVRYDNYSDFGGTINPRVALVWDINKQLTSKLLYGSAFRAPSFTEQGNQNGPAPLGNKDLKPETINTYEWAVDYRPVASFRTSVNLYYYQIKDLIEVAPQTATFQNSGNQDGYGTELEWNWQVFEQWNVMGNYAWQHATNEEINQQATGVPEHHVYGAFQWQFMPNWQLQPQINWIGNRINPIATNEKLGDYETIDLTLRGKKLFGHLNVTASIRNMFDTTYREPATANISQNLPMQGRSFYLEASVNY